MPGSSTTFPSILPKPSQDITQGPPPLPPQSPQTHVKRKRSFVALACVACRKRKTKCDGRRPFCSPCEQRRVECVYDFPDNVPAAQRGKRAIERLSQANVDLKNVIDTLRQGDEEHALAVVRSIRASETWEKSLESIMESTTPQSNPLGGAYSKTRTASQLPPFQKDLNYTTSPTESLSLGFGDRRSSTGGSVDQNVNDLNTGEQDSSLPRSQLGVEILPLSSWTSVPGDDQIFSELLALLWNWDTLFTGLIDRLTFEADLRHGALEPQKNSPKRQFCSTFLVNALLGFASTYTMDEFAFKRDNDPLSRGQPFIAQAEREIERKKTQPTFDLLQGLIMLFAYEARIGDAKKAKAHIDLVFELYNRLDFSQAEVDMELDASDLDAHKVIHAKSRMVWGFYIFEWRLSYTYGIRLRFGKPTLPKLWQIVDDSGREEDKPPEYWWFQWPRSSSRRRSFYNELFDAECRLIEIAEIVLEHLYPNQRDRPASAPSQAQSFTLVKRLFDWKRWYMNTIQEEAYDLPHALQISYCYEMLVVVVLRKVAHLTKEEFGTSENPGSLCHMHTNQIVAILWNHRSLYTIRYEFWAIQACSLVAFSTIFNLDQNTTLLDSFEKVCKMLFEISQVYPVAADILYGIRVLVQKNNVNVSKIATEYLSMVDGPRQRDLTEEWRAPVILAKDDGTRGGVADISLGDMM